MTVQSDLLLGTALASVRSALEISKQQVHDTVYNTTLYGLWAKKSALQIEADLQRALANIQFLPGGPRYWPVIPYTPLFPSFWDQFIGRVLKLSVKEAVQ